MSCERTLSFSALSIWIVNAKGETSGGARSVKPEKKKNLSLIKWHL